MSACKEAIMKVRKMACLPAALEAILDAAVRADGQHQGEPVALPARKDPTQGWAVPGGVAKADGWNECLDEIAKLGPLYSRPVQGEVVGWQFYQQGKWWNGDDRIKDHRKNTEAAGIATRDIYSHADPAEVERLRDENRRLHEAGEFLDGVNQGIEDKLRARLAEAHALLEDWHTANCTGEVNVSDKAYRIVTRTAAMLSASAEPSAPVEIDESMNGKCLDGGDCGVGGTCKWCPHTPAALERKP